MANAKGNPENLKPVRSKDEAKKRGAVGGIKSGETRRKKRDAKQAISLLLNMAAKGNLDNNLQQLGFSEQDRTNMSALTAAMFTKAMGGDVTAYKALMDYGGFNPDQDLKNKERKARIKALEESGHFAEADNPDEENEDVLIYMPEKSEEGGT